MIAADACIENAARDFRRMLGAEPRYPCDLEECIVWSLPLDVRRVDGLRVSYVALVARKLGMPYSFEGKDRRLCGCLLAHADRGIIFLDGSDQEDERRFTLAHELAHYLLDYLAPRQRALQSLGERIRPVLDGVRPPTMEERLYAVMEDAPLGVLSHLMERPSGGVASTAVLNIETRADQLALELLAPAYLAMQAAVAARTQPYNSRLAHLSAELANQYGLPPAIARYYAATLLHRSSGPTVKEWLSGME